MYLASRWALEEGLLPLVNRAARGGLDESLARYLRTGAVTPLYKDEERTKIRPIVPLNAVRKLVSSLLLRATRERLQQELRPIQWGVGEPAGVETIIFMACLLTDRDTRREVGFCTHGERSFGIVTLDFQNAYGEIRRPHALREVANSRAWPLAPFLLQQYARPADLLLPITDGQGWRERVESARGVTQGDPQGPAAFALAVLGLGRELAQIAPSAWLVDDCTLIAPVDALNEALRYLEQRLQEQREGLRLNWDKCRVWFPEGEWPAAGHPLYGKVVPVEEGGLTVLGAPVGKKEFVRNGV